jgi:hypothetical protein
MRKDLQRVRVGVLALRARSKRIERTVSIVQKFEEALFVKERRARRQRSNPQIPCREDLRRSSRSIQGSKDVGELFPDP